VRVVVAHAVAVVVKVGLPHPPHGIFIVVVAPAPLAVTQAPVKLRVVTVVERLLPSSCVVIVPPPHPVEAIVSCLVAQVHEGVIVIFVPANNSASVCALVAESKSLIVLAVCVQV
jgi:hypothetical protein